MSIHTCIVVLIRQKLRMQAKCYIRWMLEMPYFLSNWSWWMMIHECVLNIRLIVLFIEWNETQTLLIYFEKIPNKHLRQHFDRNCVDVSWWKIEYTVEWWEYIIKSTSYTIHNMSHYMSQDDISLERLVRFWLNFELDTEVWRFWKPPPPPWIILWTEFSLHILLHTCGKVKFTSFFCINANKNTQLIIRHLVQLVLYFTQVCNCRLIKLVSNYFESWRL